ncbi:MAG: type II restriction endonuclease [Candidatus Gastranaerophilales bacterium]
MKYLEIYNELFNCKSGDEVFNYLIKNLKPSNNLWSYFVNWEKVYSNVKHIEIGLNLLNYLIGKENFDEELKTLIKEQPQVIKILPALVVSRENKFDILIDYKNKQLKYENYDFTIQNPTAEDIDKYLKFVQESGLKELICSGKVKSLVDYMIGVEAGLDSNGRKNRGGHSMEDIVEVFIKDLCLNKGYTYLKEANAEKIKQEFNIDVPVDKSSRRYDFVVKTDKELVIFEVNFYGGGGSKLKSTAGEYRDLYNVLENKFKFIWITDGLGWKTTQRPLRETFDHNDYLISLSMLEKEILEKII